MNTITTIPPLISTRFDAHLLSRPFPRFNAENLLFLAKWIEKRVNSNEFRGFPGSIQTLKDKINHFMELYDQVKSKEKESEGKTFVKAKRPFYRPRLPNKNDQRIYERLDDRRKASHRMVRKNTKA